MTGIPSSKQIVAEAARLLELADLPSEEVRCSFDKLLNLLSSTTLAIYERYEEQSNAQPLPQRVLDASPEKFEKAERVNSTQGFRQATLTLMSSLYPELRKAFLSVSQGRKSRGGKSFEEQFALLLKLAGFPFQKQSGRFRMDFVLPSGEAFQRNRTICVVASLKHTLRERWQEVAGELRQLQAPNIFLVTGDDQVSPGHVRGICDANGIHLVVWDSVKDKYPDAPLVLGFTEFANVRLPMLQQQWTTAGLS